MIAPIFSPFGPSATMVSLPGYHGSIGTHGKILWYFRTISPLSLNSNKVLKGFPSGFSSPVSEKTPHTLLRRHASAQTSVSGPGAVVVKSRHLVGWKPCVLYSGKLIKSTPG